MTRVREWTLGLLIIAIAAGAYLRFAGLNTTELSADEGASWAAASAPSFAEVLRRQAHLNPGELGLHDLVLHFWIRSFGDSVAAMRSLSALAGVIAIALVFFAVREIFSLTPCSADPAKNIEDDPATTESAALVAAIAAILIAVNLVTIKYSREARMYPLALALTLAQLWCFLRAVRHSAIPDLIALAIFTGCAIATTFSTALILVPEGLYTLVLLRANWAQNFRYILRIAIAIFTGIILLVPAIMFYLHNRGGAPNPDTWSWISPPVAWDSITLFNKATGTYVFPLMAILAVSGAIRSWRTRSGAVLFLILWMLAPPLLLTLLSYLFRPAFVERYLLSCFVPFFALAALGILELEPAAFRPGALAIVVALALAHVETWASKPHTPQWAEAAAIAVNSLKPSDTIGVAPRYADNVVRYYLRDQTPTPSVTTFDAHPAPAIVIIANSFDSPAHASLVRDYPQLLAHPRDLAIRRR